ncbi:flavohemoprotein [Pseudozyma hubeiensis SY62]|uniref:Flavohemoprotein n=1 Tax=Pseudozyma hubeiensis (strain SY62) TaxID=1305764 RepID=R9PA62_PSEHS|nr:flavohemoprotein [Pseudozyma hubeiensis SY62]GAC98263.1 flavohemoprotein [Pseudozyma hubeiensis SY62]
MYVFDDRMHERAVFSSQRSTHTLMLIRSDFAQCQKDVPAQSKVPSAPSPPLRLRPAPPPLYRTFPPTRVFTSPTSPQTDYESIYRSFLSPLNLYHPNPTHYATVTSPRGHDRLSPPSTLLYLRKLSNDPSYISPRAGEPLTPIISRMHLLTSSLHPTTAAEQRSFLALFEDVSRQARFEVQNALHPENVSAQHKAAVEMLRARYGQMIGLLKSESNVDKLTGLLDADEVARFLEVHELLVAEENLLEMVGKSYAGAFPRL